MNSKSLLAIPLSADLSWILTPLLEAPCVVSGLLYSRDGLILGRAPGLDTDTADALAAATSSALSIAREVVRCSGGAGISDLVIGTADGGVYYIAPAGVGAGLALWAAAGVDLGRLAQETQVQVGRLATALDQASAARTPTVS
ncbi:roadblock/LC7 domain-containing protein [Streptomyces sp. NPDC059255]|uniref:roadblock/LC7 domain-containing protein n=1 Tax=Streptomyces sp. NPDC059255 TaxID=3346793 RepID=UPI0036BBAC08